MDAEGESVNPCEGGNTSEGITCSGIEVDCSTIHYECIKCSGTPLKCTECNKGYKPWGRDGGNMGWSFSVYMQVHKG